MMTSIAIDVLPVARSPMMSSRWPRPSANIASTARRPVADRLADTVARDDGRRVALDRMKGFCGDRLATVERTPQRIDDAAEKSGADRRARDLARSEDALAGLDDAPRIEQNDADAIGFEREREAQLAMLEAQQAH